MNTKEIIDELNEVFDGDDLLFADGFEDALIGTVVGACREPVACYDYAECVKILIKRDKMNEETACEYLDFNVVGAYVGDRTPLFLHNMRKRRS